MNHDLHTAPPSPGPQFLSEAACQDVLRRLVRYAKGGGEMDVTLISRWMGNVRWARNRITTAGEDCNNYLLVRRIIRGAESYGKVVLNEVSDAALAAAARRADRFVQDDTERVESDLITRPDSPLRLQDEPAAVPNLFFDATYRLGAGERSEAARKLMASATAAGMLSAGYVETSAISMASLGSWGYSKYYQYTWAQYSVTVRDPKGIGSGWAGVDEPDWSKIPGEQLSQRALEKCLQSRNPVAVEPGRYTAILEPQAVGDFVGLMMAFDYVGRRGNEVAVNPTMPFHKPGSGDWEPPNLDPATPFQRMGAALLGEKVIDERLTISADPMDPELGFPPYTNFFTPQGNQAAYHPVTWIERGVLKQLSYDRAYAAQLLSRDTSLLNSGAFRMSVSGTTTSIEEMIATTKRGLLVTRFDQVEGPADGPALICRGYTRDGLWLIENGKISKPVKNMLFLESIMFALNNVEQVGVPQRIFHPMSAWPHGLWEWYMRSPMPMIVPPLKVKDFSFTALSDAI